MSEPHVAEAVRGDAAAAAAGSFGGVDRPRCRRGLGSDVLSADG
jgi:hypothetical protein